jgi:hypothetical protein
MLLKSFLGLRKKMRAVFSFASSIFVCVFDKEEEGLHHLPCTRTDQDILVNKAIPLDQLFDSNLPLSKW